MKKHYLNFPQQLDIPFVGYEAQCKTNTRTADTTHSSDSMNVVGHEVRKVIVNYMKGLHTTKQLFSTVVILVIKAVHYPPCVLHISQENSNDCFRPIRIAEISAIQANDQFTIYTSISNMNAHRDEINLQIRECKMSHGVLSHHSHYRVPL